MDRFYYNLNMVDDYDVRLHNLLSENTPIYYSIYTSDTTGIVRNMKFFIIIDNKIYEITKFVIRRSGVDSSKNDRYALVHGSPKNITGQVARIMANNLKLIHVTLLDINNWTAYGIL